MTKVGKGNSDLRIALGSLQYVVNHLVYFSTD